MTRRLYCRECGQRVECLVGFQTWMCRVITRILGPDDATNFYKTNGYRKP